MKDSLMFLSNFIRNPKETGAVAPSSKYLTKEITKSIDFKNSKYIVELGPGTGIFTKAILKKASQDAKIICFEVNKKFCSYLSKNFDDDRLIVLNAGAEKIKTNLKKLNINGADCIVSGLPFKNFSNAKKRIILAETKNSLMPEGRFVVFQYTNGLSKMLKEHFNRISRKFVPLNIPPSFVYICEK